MAVFRENGKIVRTTHFGARGMSDYTRHKDKTRKARYIKRHKDKTIQCNHNNSIYKKKSRLGNKMDW